MTSVYARPDRLRAAELLARLEARRFRSGLLADDLLVALTEEVEESILELYDGLIFWSDTVAERAAVLAGLDHATAFLARVRPELERRRAEVEALGTSWAEHVAEADAWRSVQVRRAS